MRIILAFLFPVSLAFSHQFSNNTLVVYESGSTDSTAVAQHYAQARGIPAANLCALSLAGIVFPSYANVWDVTADQWHTYIKPAIQTCLTQAGRSKIYYIVFAYLRLFGIETNTSRYSIDGQVEDIWDQVAADYIGCCNNAWVVGFPHPYFVNDNTSIPTYAPFVSFQQWRIAHVSTQYYVVFRLDGPTPAIANGLVDSAIAVERAGGLKGQACINSDLNPLALNLNYGLPYAPIRWDAYRAGETAQVGGMILHRNYAAQQGIPPPYCANTALQASWTGLGVPWGDSYGWQAGSIGWDRSSDSCINPRDIGYWCGGNLLHGLTVTAGPLAEPLAQGNVRPAGAFRDLLLNGSNVGDAFLRNNWYVKWVIVYIGDPLYVPFPAGSIPTQQAARLRGRAALRGTSRAR